MTDSNDQCELEMGAVETKFFQFLLTEEERKEWKLPGEEEILRKMKSSESDMSAHLQKNFNPNKHMGPSPSNDTPLIYAVRFEYKLFLNECLRFGGDPFVTNANGQTAFHVACASSRSSQSRNRQKEKGTPPNALRPACEERISTTFYQWFGPREEKWNGQELCLSSVCVSVGQGVVVVVVVVVVCVCVCVCSHVSMLCRMRIHHYIWLLSLVYLDVLK